MQSLKESYIEIEEDGKEGTGVSMNGRAELYMRKYELVSHELASSVVW